MGGTDGHRGKLLQRLRARRAALARATLDGAQAAVGTPVEWPSPHREERDAGPADAAPANPDTGMRRIVIRETEDGLALHRPASRSFPQILFLLVWLSFWAMGEAFALREIVRTPLVVVAFLFVWLTLWTLGGLVVAGIVLWQLFGNERLFIVRGAVTREINIGPLRFRRDWLPGEAGDFAIVNSGTPGKDAIAFRTGGATRRFGTGIHRTGLEQALAAIARHMPPAARGAAAPRQ